MSILQIVFLVAALVTLFCAVMVVISTRMMHAAFWLVGALLGVAVLFALLESRFFAVVQVLVYIGAIAILIIFAVMLTRKIMDENQPRMNNLWGLAFIPVGGYVGRAYFYSLALVGIQQQCSYGSAGGRRYASPRKCIGGAHGVYDPF